MKIQVQSTSSLFHEILHHFYSMVNCVKGKFYKLALGSQIIGFKFTRLKTETINLSEKVNFVSGKLCLLR